MTAWTPERERRAIVQHAARCVFCRALFAHSRRRGDRLLLDAAEQLAWGHAENDAEREAFNRRTGAAAVVRFVGPHSTRHAVDPRPSRR